MSNPFTLPADIWKRVVSQENNFTFSYIQSDSKFSGGDSLKALNGTFFGLREYTKNWLTSN